MKHICILALPVVLLLTGCNFSKPSYFDRSSDEVTSFDFQHHSSDMYATAARCYDFDKYKSTQFRKWQKNFRKDLKHALGIDIIEQQLQGYRPAVTQVDCEDIGFALRQRWTIQTEPDVNLPFVLIIPKEIDGKAPLVITPHGHGRNTEQYAGIFESPEDSLHAIEGDRDMAFRFAQRGFITITPTARGFGNTRADKEIEGNATSSCRTLMKRDALVGRTPVGDRVWDIMRLIDWALETLPVDERNIIVSGNSGGGTQSVYSGAIDPRITICMPASSFSSYEASIGLINHCECNYIPGILNLGDMGDVAGLVAPRALCLIQGVKDNIFPIDGARGQFEKTKRIFKAAGVEENCELFEGPEGHRYYFDGAIDFVERHLAK